MRPKIILFGDSVTEMSFLDGGWGALLANNFNRTADVLLRGYSGYNTRWALKGVEIVFSVVTEGGDGPAAVTIFFGANDAALVDNYNGFQHVPIDEYKQNLLAIVGYIKKRWPSTVVILITPPPVDEEARVKYPYTDNPSGLPERTNEATGTYARACIEAAVESGATMIDLWTKMQQYPDWKSLLSDGLHLTASGNKVVYEEVIEKLQEEGLDPDVLPADLPLITFIDPNDPLKALENL